MDGDKIRRLINRILTALAVVMLAIWAWKFFGPGSGEVRRESAKALGGIGMTFGSLFWIAIAAVCCGYLLWRFMTWFFWRKYFKDEDPPEDDE
ncbi:MAG: hypothetical protein HUJ86_07685 [Synergistes sp.]|nr:hypothetical protein [Synergistes sp.]